MVSPFTSSSITSSHVSYHMPQVAPSEGASLNCAPVAPAEREPSADAVAGSGAVPGGGLCVSV